MNSKLKILAGVMFIFIHGAVFAGINIDPICVETVLSDGGGKAGIFIVLNTGQGGLRVRVSPEKWDSSDIDIDKWLTFETSQFDLAPGEKREVKYRIKNIEEAVGELKCMVFFIADNESSEKSSSMDIGIRFGVPVYAVMGGSENIEAIVQDIKVIYEKGVIKGTIFINNTGNAHIRPNVTLEVKDNKDTVVHKFEIPYGQPAQAKQNRPFGFEFEKILKKGKYKLFVTVDYGKLYGINKLVYGEKVFSVGAKRGGRNENKKK